MNFPSDVLILSAMIFSKESGDPNIHTQFLKNKCTDDSISFSGMMTKMLRIRDFFYGDTAVFLYFSRTPFLRKMPLTVLI